MTDGTAFPKMPAERRAAEIDRLERAADSLHDETARLSGIVGDPEDVVDADGWTPQDRRRLSQQMFAANRARQVPELREEVRALTTAAQSEQDATTRLRLEIKTGFAASRLAYLEGLPPLTPDDMCPDCPHPLDAHTGLPFPNGHPCIVWPKHRKRLEEIRRILESARQNPPPAPKSAPKPIAVLPAAMPIADVIERLTEVHADHPDAEVRRDRASRFEIWLPETTTGDGAADR